ncbi:MAG TPA: DUF58 domain-containing protein [Trueperaceae bacterium]
MEFEEYRSYQPGDDFSRVDTAAFLRTGQHQVKRYAVERSADIVVFLDMSASMATGTPLKLLLARQITASIGYVALAGGDRVRICVGGPGQEWSHRLQGVARFGELVNWLARRERVGGGVEAEQLERMFNGLPPGRGLIFLVSDCLIAGIQETLLRLRIAGRDVVVHQVLSPEELDPGLLGQGPIDLLDSETGDRVECDLGEENSARYRAELESWNKGIERSLLGAARYFQTRSDSPLEDVVLGTWRARGLIA